MNQFLPHCLATLAIAGASVAMTVSAQVKEGDNASIDFTWPVSSLKEAFDGAEHNTPVKMENWVNAAQSGTRAWWGHTFDDGNRSLKVTGYDENVPEGFGEEMVATIVMPPFNSRGLTNHLFAFRVMGENLTDDMTDALRLLYVADNMEGGVDTYPIEFASFPATAADNGVWRECVVDLDRLSELDDPFALAFCFTSRRDRSHKATYYIDDVRYNSAISYIKPIDMNVELNTVPGSPASYLLKVLGRSLDGDINLSLEGEDADKFTLSATTLPYEGGRCTVEFPANATPGVYNARIVLTSEGAPDNYITLTATNIDPLAAIESADADLSATAIDLDGRTLRVAAAEPVKAVTIHSAAGALLLSAAPEACAADIDLSSLAKGVIVVTVATETQIVSKKLAL